MMRFARIGSGLRLPPCSCATVQLGSCSKCRNVLLGQCFDGGVIQLELAERFQKIMAYCEQIPMAQFERSRIQIQLEYFLKQSLCDLDRRDAPPIIAQNFKLLLQCKKVDNVLAKFRQQPRFWNEVAVFVGDVGSLRSTGSVKPEIDSVREFFRILASRAQQMPESQRVIKVLVRFGIQVLILESERPLPQRHPEEIASVWRILWPILNREGILREFQSNEALKAKVKDFIAGVVPPHCERTNCPNAAPFVRVQI